MLLLVLFLFPHPLHKKKSRKKNAAAKGEAVGQMSLHHFNAGHHSRGSAFNEGHYEQIEVAAKLANNGNDELADKFLSFLISKDAQDIIPETQWMYPVVDDVKLSSAFEQLINIEKPLRIDAKEVDINNEKWIREWEASLSK